MYKDYMELLPPAEFGAPPSESDNDNHAIADSSKWWQESSLFTWGDARTGHAGEIRIGVHANMGVSNLYTWTVVDQQMADHRLVIDQPMPAAVLNGSVAGAEVKTLKPLMEYALRLEKDDLSIEATWRNFRHPLSMGYNVGGATIAKGHYNAMGEIKGVGRYRGREFIIDAVGFSDHSWGVRRNHLPASRSLFCVFHKDFYIMAIPVCSGTARSMVGYVYKDGVLGHLLTESEMGYSFRDDWVTPAGCDATLRDDQGRTFHLKGWTFGPSSTQTMGHGKFVTHAGAGFMCDGFMGSGILESAQFKGPTPGILKLGLPQDSWWLNEDAE